MSEESTPQPAINEDHPHSQDCHILLTDKRKAGAYGTVYIGTRTIGGVVTPIAAKRSHLDMSTEFHGNVRELDFLNRLNVHPFVISILTLNLGSPDSVYPLSPCASGRRDDPLWPILEQAAYDGYSLIMADQTNLPTLKMAFVQVMLALEFMHAKNLIHRDVKPTNMLWVRGGDKSYIEVGEDGQKSYIKNDEDSQKRYMKLGDFGMSDYYTEQDTSSPYVVTSWYRAPEVAGLNTDYTTAIDIWSMGCILYELSSRKALISDIGQDDNNQRVLSKILGLHPTMPSSDLVANLNKANWKLQPPVPIRQRFSYIHRASVSPGNRISEFGEEELSHYEDLLHSMLHLDHKQRITSSQVIDHPFFSEFREYAEQVRAICPPVPDKPHIVNIVDCVERQIASDICFTYYNNRSKKQNIIDPSTGKIVEVTIQPYPWYSHRIMFQSLDMFYRYLEYLSINNIYSRNSEEGTDGRFHTMDETDLCYRVCLYMSIKLLAMPDQVRPFSSILPKKYHENLDHFKQQAEMFELRLMTDIFNFKLYRETVYDRFPYKLSRSQTRQLLIMFGRTNRETGIPLNDLITVYSDKLASISETNRSPGVMSPPPVHKPPPAPMVVSPTFNMPTPNPNSNIGINATTSSVNPAPVSTINNTICNQQISNQQISNQQISNQQISNQQISNQQTKSNNLINNQVNHHNTNQLNSNKLNTHQDTTKLDNSDMRPVVTSLHPSSSISNQQSISSQTTAKYNIGDMNVPGNKYNGPVIKCRRSSLKPVIKPLNNNMIGNLVKPTNTMKPTTKIRINIKR